VTDTAISVIGLGKLGLSFAACLADAGYQTIGVDVLPDHVRAINDGRCPIAEPGLDLLVRAHAGSRLRATLDMADAVEHTDVTFIIVPTPSEPDGGFSNALVATALDTLAGALRHSGKPDHLVVISSTLMPGTIDGELAPLLEARSGRRLGEGVDICYDPDFLALGEAIHGLRQPDLVLIGASSAASGDRVEAIHRRMLTTSHTYFARMNILSAELTKISLNAYVTMKISFANLLGQVCARTPGADVDAITRALGSDSRISPKYFSAGLPFGGTCFPRDTTAFQRMAAQRGLSAPLMAATEEINAAQIAQIVGLARAAHQQTPGAVAILGLAFRHDTPVTMMSPSIALAGELAATGIPVIGCDALAVNDARAELGDTIEYTTAVADALARASVAVVMHRDRRFEEAVEAWTPAHAATVVDCWRRVDPSRLNLRLSYLALGRAACQSSSRS
jgi:UDPglucose 6-dehydrogenase